MMMIAKKLDTYMYEIIDEAPLPTADLIKQPDCEEEPVDPPVATLTHLKELQLKPVELNCFKIYVVKQDCELKEYIEKDCHLDFRRGRVFYEFQHEFESIFEDNDLIFMKEVNYVTIKFC